MAAKRSKWTKSSAGLVAAFHKALDTLPVDAVERRQMFGCPCAFVRGNMFTGLHEDRCIVRLGETERVSLLARDDTGYFEPNGRRMKEYVALARPFTRRQRSLNRWVRKAHAYAASLPPKDPGAKRKRRG